MRMLIPVQFHVTQFPDQVRSDLRESLRTRQVNHKFLYESHSQAQKWLALHEAYSPSRTDARCEAAYEAAFAECAAACGPNPIHVIGLGCGGGHKDARLVRTLCGSGRAVAFTALDVSPAMLIQTALRVYDAVAVSQIASRDIFQGIACDIEKASNLIELLPAGESGATRIVTCFNVFQNFEPLRVLSKITALLRPGDLLLFSTNLAPGSDYAAGTRGVLPQYNNALTNEWLQGWLIDLGVEKSDGTVSWRVEPCPTDGPLLRIAAYYRFTRARLLSCAGEKVDFRAGDSLRLFFSYRYTPNLVRDLLARQGLTLSGEVIPASGEEGIFLARRGHR
jgi:uncharacterized SAM-dependent methyltransferase